MIVPVPRERKKSKEFLFVIGKEATSKYFQATPIVIHRSVRELPEPMGKMWFTINRERLGKVL